MFKAGFESLDGLSGEGDFGEEYYCAFAGVDCFLYCADVDFGLAAVGDAVEQCDGELFGVDLVFDVSDCVRLMFV